MSDIIDKANISENKGSVLILLLIQSAGVIISEEAAFRIFEMQRVPAMLMGIAAALFLGTVFTVIKYKKRIIDAALVNLFIFKVITLYIFIVISVINCFKF